MLGASLGSIAGLVAARLGVPDVARAGTDGDVVLGESNISVERTSIQTSVGSKASFLAVNIGHGGALQGFANASMLTVPAVPDDTGVFGSSTEPLGTGVSGIGAVTAESCSVGVYGDGDLGAWGNGGWGFLGTAGAEGVGGYGSASASSTVPDAPSGAGLVGQADGGVGVAGFVGAVPPVPPPGTGVFGAGMGGADLMAGGTGRIHQLASATSGAPTSGTYSKGEQIRDAAGRLWLCMEGGAPGKWVRVATVPSGALGGALALLANPARIHDSRLSGGAIGSGQTRVVSVARAIPSAGGAVVVPAGALGIAFNLTITATTSTGWLAVIPHGAAFGGTSSINWTASGQTLANGGVVGLGGDRQIDVRSVVHSGSSAHFIIDVTGYFM